jgi:hypothetical protein
MVVNGEGLCSFEGGTTTRDGGSMEQGGRYVAVGAQRFSSQGIKDGKEEALKRNEAHQHTTSKVQYVTWKVSTDTIFIIVLSCGRTVFRVKNNQSHCDMIF